MKLAGVFAPLPTPFDGDGRLDERRLRAALPRWVASPLTGFVMLGTNGEAGLLDDEEAARVVGEARQLVPRDRPLIVGTGARVDAGTPLRAARRAAELGADAVLVRTPGFFKATDDESTCSCATTRPSPTPRRCRCSCTTSRP